MGIEQLASIESDEICWVTLDEIDPFPFPKANTQIIAALRQEDEGERVAAT